MATSAHPYIPNAADQVRDAMLEAIGAGSIDELYGAIPPALRLGRRLDLPTPFDSEFELRRHMAGLLSGVRPAAARLSFLGAGAYPHDVPTICHEIARRAEFLTDYAGEAQEDHGRWQALFEYASLMADLIEMDVVTIPTYDGDQAAATALRMTGRMTGRKAVLVPTTVPPRTRARIEAYVADMAEIRLLAADPATGQIDLVAAEQAAAADDVAGLLLQTPNALGIVETSGPELAQLAHDRGIVVVASTDPIGLGYLPSPASWGADIVCGDIQSLGLGLEFGGSRGGFIAVHDEEPFVFQLPSRLFGLAPTTHRQEIGFTDLAYERTSLARREEGIEWVGTAAALGGIRAGVYLSLMGPDGLAELGQTVAALTAYAIRRLDGIGGTEVVYPHSPHWREFVLRYPIPTAQVNRRLAEHGIVGGTGADAVPALTGNVSALCVTEIHSPADIDALADALEAVLA